MLGGGHCHGGALLGGGLGSDEGLSLQLGLHGLDGQDDATSDYDERHNGKDHLHALPGSSIVPPAQQRLHVGLCAGRSVFRQRQVASQLRLRRVTGARVSWGRQGRLR